MTDIAAALATAEFECDKPSLSASQGSGLPRLACLSRRSRTRPTRRPLVYARRGFVNLTAALRETGW